MRNGLFATINIGASAFRMQISEFTEGQERILETLIKPFGLGKDTFIKGYITLDSVYKAANILQMFRHKLDEYGIKKNYKCVCTSGVREARNRSFLIDHIASKTGLKLEVIEPSDEIYIKYIGVKNDIKGFATYEKKGVLFANISSGNVSINILKDDTSLYSGSLPYGSLRLRQIFKGIPIHSRYKAYNQYIDTMFSTINSSLGKGHKIKYLVCSGSSVNTLQFLFDPKENYFHRSQLEELYESVKDKTSQENMTKLGIRINEAKVLVPMLETYLRLMNFVGTDRVQFSRKSFPNVLTRYYSNNIRDNGFRNRLRNTLYHLGSRYNFDEPHAKSVTEHALEIFDSLKELHNLGSNERMLLEAAAIIHDIGYYIDAKLHHEHSYYIAKALDMPGLEQEQIKIIAFLVLMHRSDTDGSIETRLSYLNNETQLIIRKLESILRIADSLDTSHMQLVSKLDVDVQSHKIVLQARTRKHAYLEKLGFDYKKDMFLETFGIPVELELKVLYE
jgi:exopolyphosphatase/guanosine-5'-triphosphate,3'-diphosphate pyrophosphatase